MADAFAARHLGHPGEGIAGGYAGRKGLRHVGVRVVRVSAYCGVRCEWIARGRFAFCLVLALTAHLPSGTCAVNQLVAVHTFANLRHPIDGAIAERTYRTGIPAAATSLAIGIALAFHDLESAVFSETTNRRLVVHANVAIVARARHVGLALRARADLVSRTGLKDPGRTIGVANLLDPVAGTRLVAGSTALHGTVVVAHHAGARYAALADIAHVELPDPARHAIAGQRIRHALAFARRARSNAHVTRSPAGRRRRRTRTCVGHTRVQRGPPRCAIVQTRRKRPAKALHAHLTGAALADKPNVLVLALDTNTEDRIGHALGGA